MAGKTYRTINVNVSLKGLNPFRRTGFKPQYKTLFDEWKATARRGLPNRWLHPIKYRYWQRWNLMTYFGHGTSTEPWVGLNYLGPSRNIRPSGISAYGGIRGFDRKPATAAQLKKIKAPAYDSALFI